MLRPTCFSHFSRGNYFVLLLRYSDASGEKLVKLPTLFEEVAVTLLRPVRRLPRIIS